MLSPAQHGDQGRLAVNQNENQGLGTEYSCNKFLFPELRPGELRYCGVWDALQSPAKRLMTVLPERSCISAAEVVSCGYYRQWVCCIRSYTFSYKSNLIAVGQKR